MTVNHQMINIAIVGVGNCASSLVQGIHYYRKNSTNDGLIVPEILGYHASDINIVAAFDVDAEKVGFSLEDAIFRGENNTLSFCLPNSSSCFVSPAIKLDGIGKIYASQREFIESSEAQIRAVLRSTKPDVLVNFLPVGSDEATKFWAKLCLEERVGFVNAIPSFVVSDPAWANKFLEAGVPCVGDDVKSQIGATIVHRLLVQMFESRGGTLSNTYQLNIGGNMDFKNMLEGNRISSKLVSKRNSVTSELKDTNSSSIHISPTSYVEHLTDNKIAYINLKGFGFGNSPIEIELKLSVWDSPNCAAVVMDAIRFVAGAKREGVGGPLPISDFYFKSPPNQLNDFIGNLNAREYALKGFKST